MRRIYRPGFFVFWIIIGLILLNEVCFSVRTAHAAEGIATFYTTASCQKEGTSGVWTASRERYDESAFTAALRSHDFGKEWQVCNLDNGSCIVVRHNDYGPGRKPRDRGVIIDLTPAAFTALGGKITTLRNGNQVGELRNVAVMEVL